MNQNNQIAIVVGSTGLVGKELVSQLCDASHVAKIRSITRRPINYPHPKIENHVIDFAELEASSALFEGDLLFSCLGTTKKTAGSIKAQRVIDLDYQLTCAKLAKQQGVKHYLLVSASGAKAHSLFAYPKMKGQLEDAVKELNFQQTTILQPSLLLGERKEYRTGEEFAGKVLPTLTRIPALKKMRPIPGAEVAKRLVLESATSKPGLSVFNLDEIFVD